ncbi:MAG: preprotein translocase subunit SecG [Eubacterium sp.]|nr:preprotein translocase subunit SecG [Eubacterium sp.]
MRTGLTIAFIVVCILLSIVVLMQEGKENGLTGTLTGSADTYWSKNKGHSKDAMIKKITVVLAVLFFVLAILLSSKWVA